MSDRFSRVVILSNEVDRLGGVGRFSDRIAREFDARGYTTEIVGVSVAPPEDRQSLLVPRPSSITSRTLMSEPVPADWRLKTTLDKVNPAKQWRHGLRARLRAEAVTALRSLIRQWGPETVIICTQVYGMEHLLEAGYVAADPRHPRVIGQYHGSYEGAATTNRDLARVLRAYSDVDRTVFLSKEDARQFQRAGLNNTDWIVNPVVEPKHLEQKRENVLVALGRYDEVKCLDRALAAWSSIAADFPDWRFDLYGEGPQRAKLQRQIDDGVVRARLRGRTDDVGSVLSTARLHVISSRSEGLPIAVVEAGLLGVPTVATDCAPGVRDLIEDGVTGRLVPPTNTVALAAALRELMQDAKSRDHMAVEVARDHRRFLPEHVMDRWLALFDELSR